MIKKEINVFDHANEILNGVKAGALLTTVQGDKVNTMTISWGTLGIEWGKPIFITFVREHRFTREMLDAGMEFTVSLPTGVSDPKIAGFCGTRSGRDVDKIRETGLTVIPGEEVRTPAFAEYPLTLECRVLYRQPQEAALIPEEIRLADYPQDVPSTSPLANRDYHIAYYGEIVRAYLLTEEKPE